MKTNCICCKKQDLDRNTVGINKKLLGEKIAKFYCIDCLADYLGVSVEELQEKIEQFKAEGCKLFS